MKPAKKLCTPTNISDEMYSLIGSVDRACRGLGHVPKTKILNGLGFKEATLTACESRGLLGCYRVEGTGIVYIVTTLGHAVLEDPDGSR